MDFIYHEIKDAIIHRNTLPYAPYIMILIKHCLQEFDLSDDCMVQSVKKHYIKKKPSAPPLLILVPSWLMLGRVLLLVLREPLLLP
jgi:hypothetical protein